MLNINSFEEWFQYTKLSTVRK